MIDDKFLQKVAELIGRETFDGLGGGLTGFFCGPDDGNSITFGMCGDSPFGYDYYTTDHINIESGEITDVFPDKRITAKLVSEYIKTICKKHDVEMIR